MFILECTMASQHVLCTGQGDGCTLRYPEEGKVMREQRAWISGHFSRGNKQEPRCEK